MEKALPYPATHTHTSSEDPAQAKEKINFKKPQVRRWWSERYAQGFRGFTRCAGADFIMEARLSKALAAVKLTGEGPSGLLGLLIRYQRKFIASPRTPLVKTLSLTLIKSFHPTSSLQEIGSIEQQAKRHEETDEWSVLQDNRPSLFHVSVMTKRSGDYSRAGDVIYI